MYGVAAAPVTMPDYRPPQRPLTAVNVHVPDPGNGVLRVLRPAVCPTKAMKGIANEAQASALTAPASAVIPLYRCQVRARCLA